MAQAIQLTLTEQEARKVLSSVKGSISMMGRDERHDEDRRMLQRVAIQLEAQIKIARI
jgi:hypothetical protein